MEWPPELICEVYKNFHDWRTIRSIINQSGNGVTKDLLYECITRIDTTGTLATDLIGFRRLREVYGPIIIPNLQEVPGLAQVPLQVASFVLPRNNIAIMTIYLLLYPYDLTAVHFRFLGFLTIKRQSLLFVRYTKDDSQLRMVPEGSTPEGLARVLNEKAKILNLVLTPDSEFDSGSLPGLQPEILTIYNPKGEEFNSYLLQQALFYSSVTTLRYRSGRYTGDENRYLDRFLNWAGNYRAGQQLRVLDMPFTDEQVVKAISIFPNLRSVGIYTRSRTLGKLSVDVIPITNYEELDPMAV